ncbi:aldo/keto reductase [Streptomyces sp. NPDC001530]|uniref:aldo/keto reductase n=1 Tax=Streptomyces sp. NPDC001530 TaxID=3364582 RepID=UPI003682929C
MTDHEPDRTDRLRLPSKDGMGGPARDPEAGCVVLRRAVELGVDHIDTADFYVSRDGAVRANSLIREALHPYPSNLVIATKVGPSVRQDGFSHGTAADMRGLVEANLENCDRCRAGLTAHCTAVPYMAMYGAPVGGSWGGLFSDLVRVPYADAMLVPLPTGLDPVAMASASDNWSLAWRLVAPHLKARPGARVLVVARGSIGLYVCDIARALGASEVLYVDPEPEHRTLSRIFGAATAEVLEPIPQGFDIAVEATGRVDQLALAVKSLARRASASRRATTSAPASCPSSTCTSPASPCASPVPTYAPTSPTPSNSPPPARSPPRKWSPTSSTGRTCRPRCRRNT